MRGCVYSVQFHGLLLAMHTTSFKLLEATIPDIHAAYQAGTLTVRAANDFVVASAAKFARRYARRARPAMGLQKSRKRSLR